MIRRFLLSILSAALPAAAQIPAFPGAEGFGAYAKGGRGGDVYVVTNLNSTGAGSFYNGLTTLPAAGRTIVFAVSGQIHLAGGIATRITGNKLTIAGQTAPGDGILLKDGTLRISGDDIVVRHLRFRHGKNGSGGDCIDLDSGCQNAILDHLSMSFSTDENFSSFGSPPENLTMQWSLNSWGLESHSCGGLWDQNHATSHHNLWAHNHTRNPKARPAGLLEWTNNITFDWDIGFIMGDSETPAAWKANVMGNYFICPPGNIRNTPLEKGSLDRNGYPNFSVYLANNLHDRDGDGTLNGTDRGDSIVSGSAYHATANPTGNYLKLAAPVTGSALLNVEAAGVAYKKIISTSGALRLDWAYAGTLRDEVDTRLFHNVTTRTANHITRESDLAGVSNSGFGTFAPSAPPIDTDKDGMPDSYESALGWNPAVQDHNTAVSGSSFFPAGYPSGYTRLEEYLHYLSVPHLLLLKNTATSPDIDLARFTSGFTAAPVFTLSGVSGGTATQSGTGGKLVHFTANNAGGRGGFSFTVTDGEGSAWTQQFAICISNSGIPVDLNWRGTGADWDTSSQNWLKSGTPAAFSSGDRATFDDNGAAAPVVAIPAAVLATTVEVNSSSAYTFSGAGALAASGALTKRGSGTLTLTNAGPNSFSVVSLDEGQLSLGNFTAGGSGMLSLNGGSLFLSNGTANPLEFNSPAMVTVGSQHTMTGNWTGSQPVTIQGTSSHLWSLSGTWSGYSGSVNLGSGNVKIRLNGGSSNTMYGSPAVAVNLGSGASQLMNRNGSAATVFDLGSLEATGSATQLQGAQSTATVSTYSVGALGTDKTFAGSIMNGNSGAGVGVTNLTKVGGGIWTLSGTSSHTGTTAVSAGTLLVNGALGTTATTVASGATLGGSGSIGGLVTAGNGSRISAGASAGQAGILTTSAGLTFTGTVSLPLDLSSSTAGGNDRITISGGTLSLSGATVNLNANMLQGVLASGVYNLMDGTATMAANPAPTFNLIGLPGGSRQTFSIQRQSSGGSPAFVNLVVAGTAPASLVWSGTNGGGRWDLNSTGNFTGGPTNTFYNLDAVTFDDTSTVGGVILNGILQPRLITVSNSSRAYTWSGPGMIAGSTSLVKAGNGVLTITPDIVTVGSTTVAGGNQITVTSAAGLAIGMAVMGGDFPYGTTITDITGTTLTVSATTAVSTTANITYQARNTFSGGTGIGAGSTIQLGNEAGNRWGLGTGAVTFNGGTLKLYDFGAGFPASGDFPNALVIPPGQTGTLHTMQRGSLSGPLSGGGTLNLVVKYVRGDFYGDWSAFTGQINITSATGSEFRMAESYGPEGFPNASVSLGAGVSLKHTGILSQGAGTSIPIGELSGAAGSYLLGGVTGGRAITYIIGGKGTSATFGGTIAEQVVGSTLTNLTKTGTGTWTLTGNSTWAGGTHVAAGSLVVAGSVASAGAVTVASGASLVLAKGALATDVVNIDPTAGLTGYGVLSADLNCMGKLEGRGFSSGTPGTLTIGGSAFLDGASTVQLRGGISSDLIAITGDLALAGMVQISLAPGTTFGRYPLMTYEGSLALGTVALSGIPGGTTAQLSTRVEGEVSLVIDDSDEDGLPDSWENGYLGNLLSDGGSDPDGDGQRNAVEFLAATNPADGASFFAATITTLNASQWSLTWNSVPGKFYRIEASTTLGTAWDSLTTVAAANFPATHTSYSVTRSGPRVFYRVVVAP